MFFLFSEPLSDKEYQELANAIYTIIKIAKMKRNKIMASMSRFDYRINILNSALCLALTNPNAAEKILKSEWEKLRLIECVED